MPDSRQRVASGFKIVYAGLVMVVLAVVFNVIVAFLNSGPRGPRDIPAIVLVTGLMAMAGSFISLGGRVLCMAVPRQAGNARQLLAASITLSLLTVLITFIGIVDLFADIFP